MSTQRGLRGCLELIWTLRTSTVCKNSSHKTASTCCLWAAQECLKNTPPAGLQHSGFWEKPGTKVPAKGKVTSKQKVNSAFGTLSGSAGNWGWRSRFPRLSGLAHPSGSSCGKHVGFMHKHALAASSPRTAHQPLTICLHRRCKISASKTPALPTGSKGLLNSLEWKREIFPYNVNLECEAGGSDQTEAGKHLWLIPGIKDLMWHHW